MVTDSSDILTVAEIARLTKQSTRQIYGHIEAGNLKYINIGLGKKKKSYIFTREQFNNFLKKLSGD